MDLSVPDAVIDNLGVVLLVVGIPLAIYLIYTNLTEGFLPPRRRAVPGPGKLAKMLSPQLRAFVAGLPGTAGDALAKHCRALAAADVPLHALGPRAVMPLWQGPDGPLAAWITHSRGVPTKLEFVRFAPLAPKARNNHEVLASTEQGFLAWFVMRLLVAQGASAEPMQARELARRAADALGFRYLDDTLAWHGEWLAAHRGEMPAIIVDEQDDPDEPPETPVEVAEYKGSILVDGIDERERAR
jgi:hypothetical protein